MYKAINIDTDKALKAIEDFRHLSFVGEWMCLKRGLRKGIVIEYG